MVLEQLFLELRQFTDRHPAGASSIIAAFHLRQPFVAEIEGLKIEELEEYTRSRVTSIEDRTYELSQVEDEVIDAHGSLVALERDEQVCRANPDCPESEWEQMDQRIQSLEAEFEAAVDTLQIAYQATGDGEDLVMNPDQFTGTAAEIVAIPGTVLIYPIVLQDKLWILWGTSGVSNAIEVPVTQGEIGEAVLRFRQREETGFRRFSLTLPPRSAYVLSGEVRHQWEHSIAPAGQLRFSITFRTLSDKGLTAAERRA